MSDNSNYCVKCGARLKDYYSDYYKYKKNSIPPPPPDVKKTEKCDICGKQITSGVERCSVCGKAMCGDCATKVDTAIKMNRMDKYASYDFVTVNRMIPYDRPLCLECALTFSNPLVICFLNVRFAAGNCFPSRTSAVPGIIPITSSQKIFILTVRRLP